MENNDDSDADPESFVPQLILIIVLTLINAFFASAEMAVVSANKNKIRRLASDGNKKAKAVEKLCSDETKFLSTIQVGITLASDFVPFPGGVVVSENLLLAINESVYGPLLATSAMILLRTISFYLFVIFCAIVYLIFHSIKRKRVVDL